MNLEVVAKVDNKIIIAAGTAILFEDNKCFDITIRNIDDPKDNLNYKLKFINTEDKVQNIKYEINDEEKCMEIICANFNKYGTGTTKPIPIGEFQNGLSKNIVYFHFWCSKLGDTTPWKIDYTFYLGEDDGKL